MYTDARVQTHADTHKRTHTHTHTQTIARTTDGPGPGKLRRRPTASSRPTTAAAPSHTEIGTSGASAPSPRSQRGSMLWDRATATRNCVCTESRLRFQHVLTTAKFANPSPPSRAGKHGTFIGSYPRKGHDVIMRFHDYYCATIRVRRAIGT